MGVFSCDLVMYLFLLTGGIVGLMEAVLCSGCEAFELAEGLIPKLLEVELRLLLLCNSDGCKVSVSVGLSLAP